MEDPSWTMVDSPRGRGYGSFLLPGGNHRGGGVRMRGESEWMGRGEGQAGYPVSCAK